MILSVSEELQRTVSLLEGSRSFRQIGSVKVCLPEPWLRTCLAAFADAVLTPFGYEAVVEFHIVVATQPDLRVTFETSVMNCQLPTAQLS